MRKVSSAFTIGITYRYFCYVELENERQKYNEMPPVDCFKFFPDIIQTGITASRDRQETVVQALLPAMYCTQGELVVREHRIRVRKDVFMLYRTESNTGI